MSSAVRLPHVGTRDPELASYTAVMFLVAVMLIPRSYAPAKLVFLFLFLVAHLPLIVRRFRTLVDGRVAMFYLSVMLLGLIWSIVGMFNFAEPMGIFDSLRLYVLWSLAYLIIVSVLLLQNALRSFHLAIIISGIAIPLLNVFGLLDYVLDTGAIPYEVKRELDLFVGIHDGYIQITSHNIGSLFFICAYLITVASLPKTLHRTSVLEWLALVLSIAMAVISGRRALWLCLFAVPFLIIAVAYVARLKHVLNPGFVRAVLYVTAFAMIAICAAVVTSSDSAAENSTVQHLLSALSSEDERTIQRGYLLATFYQYPLWGTGFGMGAGYIRNDERPWLYELTYHQLLMNFGIIGTIVILFLTVTYITLLVRRLQHSLLALPIGFSLLLGFISFLIGSYSNPYLGSFDFLLFVAILPLLSVASKANDPPLQSLSKAPSLNSAGTLGSQD